MKKQPFVLDGLEFNAEDCVNGVLINPELPDNFDDCPNEARTEEERLRWWNRRFIVTHGAPTEAEWREGWFKAWPSGTRYDVRALDGGAWDRSTVWGQFASLEEALKCELPRWLDPKQPVLDLSAAIKELGAKAKAPKNGAKGGRPQKAKKNKAPE